MRLPIASLGHARRRAPPARRPPLARPSHRAAISRADLPDLTTARFDLGFCCLRRGLPRGDDPSPSTERQSHRVSPVASRWEPSTMLSRVPGPKSRKGFTLVELAVVIVIIGVLAAF